MWNHFKALKRIMFISIFEYLKHSNNKKKNQHNHMERTDWRLLRTFPISCCIFIFDLLYMFHHLRWCERSLFWKQGHSIWASSAGACFCIWCRIGLLLKWSCIWKAAQDEMNNSCSTLCFERVSIFYDARAETTFHVHFSRAENGSVPGGLYWISPPIMWMGF